MSQEILYTSAPQGLKPGSRGFCTVAGTAGIAKNLLERLESFSGYRHAFMAHEAQAAQNPVNYAHYHTTVGGRKYHVLSRVADAGLDYTQRSNKLAHHVALEPNETELAPGGPAWVMATPGFFVEQWDGEVRTWPVGRDPPGSERPTPLCQRWQTLTGDAGWGGVLAESALRKGSLMSVIFPAGTPVLELVVESLGLLPPEKRWEVTFSTYFTKAPAGVDCQWRFLLDGTPEATALRRDVRAAVIDLCQPLGQAQGGDLVQAARNHAVSPRSRGRSPAPLQRPGAAAQRPAAMTPQTRADEPEELKLAPLSPLAARPASAVPAWLPSAKPAKRKRWRWALIGSGVFLMSSGVFLCLLIPWNSVVSRNESPAPAVTPTVTQREPPIAAPAVGPADVSHEEATAPESLKAKERRDYPEDPPAMTEPPPLFNGVIAPRKQGPFKDIRRRKNCFQLPPSTNSVGIFKPEPNTERVELALLDLSDIQSCCLELSGSEWLGRNGMQNRLEYSRSGNNRFWDVISSQPLTTKQKRQDITVGTFSLRDGRLWFNWIDPTRSPLRLQFCLLRITVELQAETCTFNFEPKEVSSGTLDGKSPARIDLKTIPNYKRGPRDQLHLSVRLRSPSQETFDHEFIVNDQASDFSVPVHSYQPGPGEPNVFIKVSVDDNKEAIAIKSVLIADIPLLVGPRVQFGDDYLQPGKWRIDQSRIELTDSVAKTQEEAEAVIFRFKRFAVEKKFEIGEWLTQVAASDREAAVKFAAKNNELANLSAEGEKDKEARQSLTNELNEWPGRERCLTLYNQYRLDMHCLLAEQSNLFASMEEKVKAWYTGLKRVPSDPISAYHLEYRLWIAVDNRRIDLVVSDGASERSPAKKLTK